METLSALDRARNIHSTTHAAGSAEEKAALDRFAEFFSSFAADRIDRLLKLTYASDLYFNDTIKSFTDLDTLGHYLKESAEAVEDCRVDIQECTRTEHGEYLVRWKMMIRFKKMKKGVDTWTVGMSHLRFDAEGRVAYHQDYWNAADGIYEHIPLLGGFIRFIKRRL